MSQESIGFGLDSLPEDRRYFLSLDEILSMTPPEWLVKDLIPRGGVGVIYGATGSYKSFLALHLAASCATGIEAFPGKPCKKADAYYIAAEAASGFRLRVDAWIRHHAVRPDRLFLRPWPVYLNEEEPLATLLEEIEKIQAPSEHSLIVVDTLSANFTGNENSSDMAAFVKGCIEISKRINATVLVVHHVGKDERKGARGHNSLSANSDFAIQMTGVGEGIKIKVEKLKDSPIGLEMQLRKVPIALDAKAELGSSLVLLEDTGFEEEDDRSCVCDLAIEMGDCVTQGEMANKMKFQLGMSRAAAMRDIRKALPDNEDIEHAGYIITRIGSGRMQRIIRVRRKGEGLTDISDVLDIVE